MLKKVHHHVKGSRRCWNVLILGDPVHQALNATWVFGSFQFLISFTPLPGFRDKGKF
ncbi:hypothetical protein [Paradesulfitobacterium aromaticivorans]